MRKCVADESTVQTSADLLTARLREEVGARDCPLFVGIDGRSGAGKSTLAASISMGFARARGDAGFVTVIEGDQFYAGGGHGPEWFVAESRALDGDVGRLVNVRAA